MIVKISFVTRLLGNDNPRLQAYIIQVYSLIFDDLIIFDVVVLLC